MNIFLILLSIATADLDTDKAMFMYQQVCNRDGHWSTDMRKQRERWRAVPGYENLYEVSDQGRVRSLDRIVTDRRGRKLRLKGKVLQTPSDGQYDYPRVGLFKQGKRRNIRVHQLVMLTFVGPCPEGMEVCHEDGDPSNSYSTNLRYDTHAANQADMKRHGTSNRGSRNPNCLLRKKQVVSIRDEYVQGGVTCAQLAARYKVTSTTIHDILTRRKWKHVGGADCFDRLKDNQKRSSAKLTSDQVKEIRRLHKQKEWTVVELMRKYKVSKSTVQQIIAYRTWKNV